jgi:anhydro-N-acetylmuramic acid kinase
MNPSIKKLAEIAQKETRIMIGLMSGTSLDGLDIALCRIKGSGIGTQVVLENFVTKTYTPEIRNKLKLISSAEYVELSQVCRQHTWLGSLHAELILEALDQWGLAPKAIDCIASHGQTIYHLPARHQKHWHPKLNSTLQIADGDHIAFKTGIITISDFRQKHTAAGGEGAPMAGFVDSLLFAHDYKTRLLLNIGGIGNFTLVPAKDNPDRQAFTTDTGPGNTLIDKLSQEYFNQPFDRNAAIARSGSVDENLLTVLLADSWFTSTETKTTGPEYFSLEWLRETCIKARSSVDTIKPEDLIRTVTELSAQTIAGSINKHLKGDKGDIFVSGGGIHNPLLMERLSAELKNNPVKNFSELGIDPDAKEAVLFAVLANEMLAGDGFPFFRHNREMQKINFGKISLPV